MAIKTIGILAFILIGLLASAQSPRLSSKNKKALNSYALALDAYDRYDVVKAENHLLRAIQADKRFVEAYLTLSQLYQETNRNAEAIASAQKAIAINPNFFPNIYYNLGNIYFKSGSYQLALENYQKFLTYNRIRAESAHMAKFRISCCKFALDAIANPVPFNPLTLGSSINTPLDEYWPSLSADENTLVITRNIVTDSITITGRRHNQEDFYFSQRNENGQWGPIRAMGAPLNTPRFNEGTQSITADGQRVYFTICYGVCNLYYSDRQTDGTWGKPVRLPDPINQTKTSEKQPSISPDGRTLYFVSNRPGGKGQFDIWYSTRIGNDDWEAPQNVGSPINTPFNEQSPFIHFDNQTLYFASDGHVGMGGLDLFQSTRLADTAWSHPLNLGYPINTHADEDGLIVNAKGTNAYFSTVREASMGRDVYMFELHEKARPTPVSYMSGTILDGKNHWPIRANFSLIDLQTNEQIMSSSSSPNGNYFVCLPSNRSYAFVASAPSYLFYSQHFNLTETHTALKPLQMNIYLNPISLGQVMVMRNVFFETASWELKVESVVELDYLVDLLLKNPSISIEVGGHTDSVGSDEDNRVLSEKRAESVVNYLLSKGLEANRLKWKGYGETMPIAGNDSDEGRALNRRTEIKVIGLTQ